MSLPFTEEQAFEMAERAMERICKRRGARAKIVRAINVKHQVFQHWRVVPVARVFAVGRALGIAVTELRPDFFMHDPLRLPAVLEVMRPRRTRQNVDRQPEAIVVPTGFGV